jgi:D-3-phosphoglycerate dehydrogenase / 2-oxoglutarate reductase
MARVLISDKLSDEGLAILANAPGIEADHRPGLAPDELKRILPEYDGLIIRSGTKVTAEVVEAGKKLRVIGRAGIGVDNVDLPAATARGIIVMNTPEGNTVTTAEHAISLMTSLARQIPQATASMRAGKWEKTRFNGKELFEQVLGVIGLGNIGSIVADRARGLRMRVIAYDPLVSDERAQRLGVDLVTLDELFAQADVISVHVPMTEGTRGLLGKAAFAKMKPGVLIVNAARGGIVDEAALLEAIKAKKVAGAALDVFEQEPPPKDHPLLQCEEVIFTPHLGAATEKAQLNVAIAVAEQVRDYLTTGVVRNAVNLPSVSAEDLDVLRPFITLGEKLGLFQGQVARGGISEIDVEYAGEIAERNVAPITVAVLRGILAPWVGDEVNFVNAPVVAQKHGVRVIETKTAAPEDYVSLLTVRVRSKTGDRHLVAGTIFGRTQPRIVRVDDFRFEAIPEGPTFLIRNQDRPGVVGRMGTLLGGAGINIKRMQLGLHLSSGQALQLLSVEPMPTPAILEAVRKLENVETAYLLDLGARVT